jgi:hypothetical protein
MRRMLSSSRFSVSGDLAMRRKPDGLVTTRDLWPPELYSLHVGSVVVASNNLHAAFFSVFTRLLPEFGHALWHALQNDKSQRDQLAAVLEDARSLNPKYKTRVLWAIKQANQISAYRNDFVHVPTIWLGLAGIQPNPFASMPSKLRRLQALNLPTLSHHLVYDFDKLRLCVAEVNSNLLNGRLYAPLQRRPRMRAHAYVEESKPKDQPRPRRRPKPKPRPPGSQN